MRRMLAPGAYRPGETLVHGIDARVKIVALLVASATAFAAPAPRGVVVVAAGLLVALAASGTSPRRVLMALRPALVILGISLLANGIVLVGQPGVSVEGLARSATAIARIVIVVGLALVFSSTTMPPAIADGIAALMAPLARLGVPVGGLSTAVSIALRFIPLASEEVERIRCAQRARGARLDEGGVIRRLSGWGQVLVPLVVSLFRRADELAAAMEDRCFTGEQTAMRGRLARGDVAVLLGVAAWAACALLA